MPTDVPVPFPLGGLSENASFTEQLPMTMRDGLNVRGIDPVTGSIRGGQRAGMEKLITGAVGGANEKVVRMISTSVANSKVIFSERTEGNMGTAVFDTTTPSKRICREVVVDLQSNIYALDGDAAWIKYNSEGEEIYKQACPVQDGEHVIRAIALDDLGGVYLGVSEGGNQRTAKIFKFQEQYDPNVTSQADDPCAPRQDAKVELVWTIAPNEYVEQLIVFQGALFAIQNDRIRKEAWLASYIDIFTVIPRENFRRRTTYPSNAFDIREDGAIFTTSPFNPQRTDDVFGGFKASAIHWTPQANLNQWEDRVWAHYDASTLDLENGDVVLTFPDISGNGRDLILGDGVSAADSPRLDKLGIGGQPAVQFPGAAMQILQSLENGQIVLGSTQRTGLPAYTGAGFAVFIVFRSSKTGSVAGDRMVVFHQPNTGSAADIISLNVNVIPGGYPGSASADHVWMFDSGTAAPNGQLLGTSATSDGTDNSGKACLVSYIHDRTQAHNLEDNVVAMVRYNGDVRDFDTTNTQTWDTQSAGQLFTLGGRGAGENAFVGHVAEIIILRDYTSNISGQSEIVTQRTTPGSFESSELRRLEGHLAWKWGCRGFLPILSPYAGRTPHPEDRDVASIAGTNPNRESNLINFQRPDLCKFAPSTAELIWSTSNGEIGEVGGFGYGVKVGCDGNVFTCGSPSDEAPAGGSAHDVAAIRRSIDLGDTYEVISTTTTTNDAWQAFLYSNNVPANGPDLLDYHHVRMDVDKFGNLYVPIYDSSQHPDGASSGKITSLYIFQQDTSTTDTDNDPLFEVVIPTEALGTAVAVDRDIPSYRSTQQGDPPANWTSDGNGLAEFIVLATDNVQLVGNRAVDGVWTLSAQTLVSTAAWASYTHTAGDTIELFGDADAGDSIVPGVYTIDSKTDDDTLVLAATPAVSTDAAVTDVSFSEVRQADPDQKTIHRLRLIDSERDATAGSPRTQVLLGVANNGSGALDIKKGDIDGGVNWDAITDGTAALDETTDYVDATVAFGKVYFTDGLSYKRWAQNPDTGVEVIEDWKSKSGGKIPPRARLMTTWRGRLVLARFADDPHVWSMSAIGDPDDWDFFPPTPISTQAVLASLTRAGDLPDAINSIVSYNDDLLFFGGDRSIWRLTGDPMSGGQLDLVTDVTGMAFGRCWTKDPQGALYFFGSRGGVFAMAPGGVPQRISLNRVERRLQNIDLGANYVELVWNYDDEGLQVFVFPFDKDPVGNGSSVKEMYFWEKKTDSWWPDQYGRTGTTNYQPTAVTILDSDDPDDRVMALGGEDGIVRKWVRDAKNDDGNSIDSHCLIGPMGISKTGQELRTSDFTAVLASDQDGCRYEFFLSDEPDNKGVPWIAGDLLPGRNESVSARARGAYLWLRLRSALLDHRWAAEHFSVQLDVGGRVRARARR